MKHYIVGAFDAHTWADHGKRWLASAKTYKGNAQILVFQNGVAAGALAPCEGVAKVLAFDGQYLNLLKELCKREGVFMFAAPNARFQTGIDSVFEVASTKFAVVPRQSLSISYPYNGSQPVYEGFWAAPYDLIDMMVRVYETAEFTDCKPPFYWMNIVSYFGDSFPWFRHILPHTVCMPSLDAQVFEGVHYDPSTGQGVAVVLLDKPEERRAGVLGGIVKPGKASLTTKEEPVNMLDDSVEGAEGQEMA